MGCWNKTCGLTNLHIKAGERAYVFVLEKDEDDSHCYTTHMYKPLLLPFETTYNAGSFFYKKFENYCG